MPSPNPREAGINPKVDTGTSKEREKEKEKEKDKRKVAKEMGSQAKARVKDPKMDVGYVVDLTTHPIALRASPKEKGKQDPPTGCQKMKVDGRCGVRVQKCEHQKCDHYQDYRL